MHDLHGRVQTMDQDRIWRHYQGEGSEVFAGAKPRLDYLLKRVARLAPNAKPAVLNVGAGDGYLERCVQRRGWQAFSLDPDEATCVRLRGQSIDARTGTIAAAPFDDQTFDFVVASEIIEHLSDAERYRALREIRRILKPRGWLLGTVPYAENLSEFMTVCPGCGLTFHRWGHQASFGRETLAWDLGSAGYLAIFVRRQAFVDFGGPMRKKIKAAARFLLARIGEPLANPLLYFEGRVDSVAADSAGGRR